MKFFRSFLSIIFISSVFIPLSAFAKIIDITNYTPTVNPEGVVGAEMDWSADGARVVWAHSPSGNCPYLDFTKTYDGQIKMVDTQTGVSKAISEPKYEFSELVAYAGGVIWYSKEGSAVGLYRYDFITQKVTQLISSNVDAVFTRIKITPDGRHILYSIEDFKNYKVITKLLDTFTNKTTDIDTRGMGPVSVDNVPIPDPVILVGNSAAASLDEENKQFIVYKFSSNASNNISYAAQDTVGYYTDLIRLSDDNHLFFKVKKNNTETYFKANLSSGEVSPAGIEVQSGNLNIVSETGMLWKAGALNKYYDAAIQSTCPVAVDDAASVESAKFTAVSRSYLYWSDKENKLHQQHLTCRTDLEVNAQKDLEQQKGYRAVTDLPKTTLSIGASVANKLIYWSESSALLNTIVVHETFLPTQSMQKQNAKWQSKLKAIEKDAPKNITAKEAAVEYLKNHGLFKKKIEDFSTSFFGGVFNFASPLFNTENTVGGSQKLRIWSDPFNMPKTISLTNPLSMLSLKPMWNAGPTGIVWLSYSGNIKNIRAAQIHWFDFAKKRDSILGKLSLPIDKKNYLELRADYNMFSITQDEQIDVWSINKRKIIKSFTKRPQALGFGSHYVAWMDNVSVVSPAYEGFKVNLLNADSGATNYFYIQDQPRSDIYIYGEHVVLTNSSKFFDYNIDSGKLNEVTLASRIEGGGGFLAGFDGRKLIFFGGSPSSIFVQPIDGSTVSEYRIDRAGQFVGFTGKYLVFEPPRASETNEIKDLPNDPFGFKAVKKSLSNQLTQLKKGAAFGGLNFYKLP